MYIYGQLDLSKVWANLLSHQQTHSLYPLRHFLYQFHPFPTFKDGSLPWTTGGPTDRPQAQLANWHKHWKSLQERQRELSPGRTWNRKGPETHTGEMSWGRVLPPHIQTTQECAAWPLGPRGDGTTGARAAWRIKGGSRALLTSPTSAWGLVGNDKAGHCSYIKAAHRRLVLGSSLGGRGRWERGKGKAESWGYNPIP